MAAKAHETRRHCMIRAGTVAILAVMSLAPLQTQASGINTIAAAYVGTWNTRTVHYKTTYSKPRTETSRLKNVCWNSAGYFACDQFVNGASKALIVFTYDKSRNMYHSMTCRPTAVPPRPASC